MVSEPFLKRFALIYLCVYASLYPIATQFIMLENSSEGIGSLPIQIFQGTVIIALLVLGRFASISVGKSLNLWFWGIGYFFLISCYFAFVRSEAEPRLELLGTARFLAWFLFAALTCCEVFPKAYWQKLAFSFWLGTMIQCVIALVMFFTHGADSTYSNVYASTGSANVSGKTITSFVALGIFLSWYWFIYQKRRRLLWGCAILLGLGVVLVSYNRACQLSLAFVGGYSFLWSVYRQKMKSAVLWLFLFFIAICLGFSSLGEVVLTRWSEIVDDQGSGRVTLIAAALNNFWSPSSLEALLIGSGYHKMELIMYEACGAYIGAHNDFFDFLIVYGVVGGIFYFCLCYKLLTVGSKVINGNCYEKLILRGATLFVLLTGLFTGLFQATYTFFMLITIQNFMITKGSKTLALSNSFHKNEQQGFKEVVGEDVSVAEDSKLEKSDCQNKKSVLIAREQLEVAFSEIDFEGIRIKEDQRQLQKTGAIAMVISEKLNEDKGNEVYTKTGLAYDSYIDAVFENEGRNSN